MPLPQAARDYLIKALSGTPVVVEALIAGRADSDPVWDKRPDPERFTLREALAHLADWEPIWVERIERILAEGHPFLPSVDEGEMVTLHDYASQSPLANAARFASGRRMVVERLLGVRDEEWDRTCDREFVGVLSLQQLAGLMLSHDGYHLRQIAEWL